MRGQLVILPDRHALAAHAAEEVASRLAAAVEERGRATIALAGGTTPRDLYHLLARPVHGRSLPWPRIDWFWGDERAVPPDHPDSNFHLALEALFDHSPAPRERLHRIHAELPSPEAARRYESEIQRSFGLEPGEWPRFDVVLLGLGSDGHTASLFPHTEALAVSDRLAAPNWVPRLGVHRVTLTFPVINHAAAVLMLVAGADKAAALARVLEGEELISDCPARGIDPDRGELLWLVDEAAAAGLAGGG